MLPRWLVDELENDRPQKWLNGAQSVLDPLDKSIRLPLSALAFYSRIHALLEAQEKWQNSVDWVQDDLCEWNLEIFDSVSWNTVHPGAPDGQLDWTRLLDDEWLSDSIIDSMMKTCNPEIHSDAKVPPTNSPSSREVASAFIDYTHCGIYTGNTLDHAIFKTPLISEVHCRPLHMDWFRKFVTKVKTSTISPDAPLLTNHNFPDLGPATFFEEVIQLPVTATPSAQSISKILNLPSLPFEPSDVPVPSANLTFKSVELSECQPSSNVPDKTVNVPVEPIKSSQPVLVKPVPTLNPTKKRKERRTDDSSAPDDSDQERLNKRAKETNPRKKKMTDDHRRHLLENDPNTVKLASGALKATPHEVYCRCEPGRVRRLDKGKQYNLKNWDSHKKTCPLVTGIQPGSRTMTKPTPLLAPKARS
ncbi:hypothetical protein B0H13DRAFT_2359543 [Mycena leptocephala]|nr:hypothetical protein B0H13DRAFT_2359543 [Mycena leptocephala]